MTNKASDMTNKISLPSNTVIIYGLAMADAFTIAYGLIVLDGMTTDIFTRALIVLRGLVVGGVGGLALAVTANKIPRARALSEKRAGWSAFGVVLFAIVAIVGPVTYATLNPVIVDQVAPVIRWIISLAAGLLVPALTAAVAFTSGKLDADESAPRASTPAPAQHAPQTTPIAPAQIALATVPCALCGVPYAAVGGKGGHYKRWHKQSAP